MLRIALIVLSLALVAPAASAGPVADAHAAAIGAVCPSPGGDLGCAGLHAFSPVVSSFDNASSALLDFVGQDDLPVALVDEAERYFCHSSPNASESVVCRQISGRVGYGGAFDLCAASPPRGNLVGAAVYTAFNAVDNATEDATSAAPFTGTPVGGEHPCHDHWETLREIAALGP